MSLPQSSLRGAGISPVAAVAVITIAALVVGGWAFDIDFLKDAGSGITMKSNAAIALLACGLSLWWVSSTSGYQRRLGMIAAAAAGVIGAATLSQHVFGWDLGIDQLLFAESPGATATVSPNRMGPNASTSLALYSIALLMLHRPTPRTTTAAQLLAAAGCILAIVPLVGYLYGTQALYALAQVTAIAANTATTLLVLGVGILCARPGTGPMAPFFSDGAGGVMLRRLWISALPLPLLLGYAGVAGHRAGHYDAALAIALVSVSIMVVVLITIWRTSIVIDAIDVERTSALANERAARAEAERAAVLKDQFLAALSHELRTPLNAILGWTQLLRVGAIAEENRPRAAEAIARNGELLGRLVEDLLDISRISAGQLALNIRPVSLHEVVGGALEAVAPAAAARGLELQSRIADGLSTIAADPERLQQILRNLLSNAIKFTDPGGRILLDVDAPHGAIKFRVSDTGHGIDPAFLPHVFERFRQEDPTSTRRHGGLGLGLAIVQDLTRLHGGRVAAISGGKGQGTTITVTMPQHA